MALAKGSETTPLGGAELIVSSRVDKTSLAEGEPLTFSITMAGPIRSTPRVHIESLKGFQVVSSGQSQQANIRSGQMQLAITLYYVLLPTAPGRYSLGPVTVEHEGKRYETSPVEVTVTASARPAPSPHPPPSRHPLIRGGTVL